MKTVKRKIKKKKREEIKETKPIVLQEKKTRDLDNGGKRILYLDNVRTIDIVLIVIWHALFLFNRYSPLGSVGCFTGMHYQDLYLYLTFPWVCQLLFVISGMTSRYYLSKHSIKEFVINRTVKCLVPSTIGVLLYHWIEGIYNMQITGAAERYSEVHGIVKYLLVSAMGINVLWYLQMLWLLSMVLAIIAWIEKGKLYQWTQKIPFVAVLLLGIGAYGAYQVLNINIYAGYAIGGSLYLFLLGYFVLAHDEVQEKLEENWIVLLTGMVGCGAAFAFLHFGDDFRQGTALHGPLVVAYTFLSILALLALGRKYLNKNVEVLQWLSKRSFGLYVFQYAPMLICAYYLYHYTYMYKFMYYLLVILTGLGVGLLMNEIISRIPLLRWCLLGISRGKSKEKTDGISK